MPSKLKSSRKKCMTNTPNCHSMELVLDFMVFIPNEKKDMIFSHAIPMHGPYRILNRTPNNAKVYYYFFLSIIVYALAWGTQLAN